jgi:hypothetical protein
MAKVPYIIKSVQDWVNLTKVANAALNKYGQFKVVMSQVGNDRSLNQNAYLWGVVYTTLKEFFLTQNDQNLELEEIHEFCKGEFGYDKIIYLPNNRVKVLAKSTTDYSTQEMMDYILRIRTHFAPFGCDIAEPNEIINKE